MDKDRVQELEDLLKKQPENALLQYSLGLELLRKGEVERAIPAFREALRLKAVYSAAYRELGKALTEAGLIDQAIQIYRQGIEVAQKQGDIQTAKEMRVFLNRLTKGAVSADSQECAS